MNDYQAIYDAVRSRISGGNIGEAIGEAIRNVNIDHHVVLMANDFSFLCSRYDRPSAIFRPALSFDGNKYCALYGNNIQDGCAGFGDTAEEAMLDFDKRWVSSKAPDLHGHHCSRCNEPNLDRVDMDGCRDPDCLEHNSGP